MNFRRHRREKLEISITPMIDIVFLLLIFFMVTTTFNRHTELQIELPEAEGQEQQAKEAIEISIDSSGQYYVNQHQVVNQKMETLKKAILKVAGDSKKPPLVIAADANTPHQYVINVLDVARELEFVHLTFATQTSPGSEN